MKHVVTHMIWKAIISCNKPLTMNILTDIQERDINDVYFKDLFVYVVHHFRTKRRYDKVIPISHSRED